jgi:hypothetical protein
MRKFVSRYIPSLAYFPHFEKSESRLICVCVSVSVSFCR